GQTPDENAINGQVYQNFYDQAFNATGLGTGGAVQQGIQAATAVVQGLAGGDIAAAIANGSAPYLAEAIGHRMGIDNNPEAKAVAHAIVGAALAAAQGQNAAAGATGAALGEITAGILKDQLYGKDTKIADLTETQKQTLSALATLSSGLAGGLAGDSTGSAVYSAQAGKTTAENNLMGGTEWTHEVKTREHGADVLSCSDNPGGDACQRGIAENKAYAGALASAGLIYLPGGMQMTAGIGGTANAGIQYLINGEINPTDVLIASYIGAATAGSGFWGTVGWNATGGATSNYLKGDDPLTGAGWGAAGSAFGYGMGKYLIETPLNKVLNPNWKNWEWTDMGMGISGPLLPSNVPGISGNAGAAAATEGGSQGGPKIVDYLKKKVADNAK
ncbi:VENN motif pre-toxin domain-containing protein, partial [Erwinia rhapontici]|uniref:VENN motif pre-toxin domain-containing protein n=1 Tax=Erwinia rhapontici TaxID=55212 RepID=UPI001F5BD3EA